METWSYELKAEMSAMELELGLAGDDYVIFGLPADTDISEDEAISIANATLIAEYAVTEDMLELYYINTSFIVSDPENKQWEIAYDPMDGQTVEDIGFYTITIDSITGEVIEANSDADAVG